MEAEKTQVIDTSERLLTEHDLSGRWQVSVKKLQKERRKGTGVTYVKLVGTVRYRLADVEAYEEASVRRCTTVTSVSKPPQK